MTPPRSSEGFTVVELAVATAITGVVMASVFLLVAPAREAFTVQPEAADVQQRVRVAVALLTKDLLSAGSGRTADDPCVEAMGAPVLPYRVGAVGSDSLAGTYYRPGVVSVASAVPSGLVRRTFYLKPVPPDSSRLMQYDGRETDHPVLEDVVGLAFEFFGAPPPDPASTVVEPAALDPEVLTDGPWCPDATHQEKFDGDLLRIRRVRVRLRVQAPRPFRGPAGPLFVHAGNSTSAGVPDQEIAFDIAPRNLNRDR